MSVPVFVPIVGVGLQPGLGIFLLPDAIGFVGLTLCLLPATTAFTLAFRFRTGLLVLDVRMGRKGFATDEAFPDCHDISRVGALTMSAELD